MHILNIALLGAPQIHLDGQPVAFESQKAVALLSFLAVEGESRLRSELATLLWPDSDTKRSRGALRYTLSILQRELGKEWLESDRNSIGLIMQEACTVDIIDFRMLLASGRDHLHPADTACPDCVPQINRAVALYRSDFLTGFGLRDSVNFDEWQFFQTEEFRHQLADALRIRIRYHSQQADYHQALASARRLLQLDPLQESVQRQTMHLYAQTNQRELALKQYDECQRLLDTELGVPPSSATTQLYEEIRTRISASAAIPKEAAATSVPKQKSALPTRPHNLPAAPLPIVGRGQEIGEIRRLLDEPHCRMITLLGPGGIGKTRLAHQIAIDLCNTPDLHFASAVYFVPLATVESGDLLVTAMADALGLTFSGTQQPEEQLFHHLQSKNLLLVLDNFEQLVPQAALLAELFNRAGGIKLLVTSRVRLNLQEEWLYEVQGLPLPPDDATPEEAAANESVQLYARRARQLLPHFDLAAALADVVQVCRLLHGMPLGIELAAGWVRTLSTAEIARQIQRDLDFLSTSAQDVPQRHRSLRAVFLHSWRSLTPEEQAIFARSAIFRGGFSLDAASTVINATPRILSALVDKSMVQHMHQPAAAPDRYRTHELLRAYGEEKLPPVDGHATHDRHCAYFVTFVEACAAQRGLADEDATLRKMHGELDNIRAAWRWLVAQIAATAEQEAQRKLAQMVGQFVPMLAYFYERNNRFVEGELLLQNGIDAMRKAGWAEDEEQGSENGCAFRLLQAEARLADLAFNRGRFQEVAQMYSHLLPQLRKTEVVVEVGLALVGLSKTLVRMGRYDEAEPHLLESIALFRSLDGATNEVQTGTAAALNGLGNLYSNQGRFAEAQPCYEEYLNIARANQHTRGIANALNNLGSNYARTGEHAQALPLYQESYRLSLLMDERLIVGVALSNLGSSTRGLGRLAEARKHYAEALVIFREIGQRRWIAATLNGFGLTLVDDHRYDEAVPLLLEALAIAQEIESLPDMLDALFPLGEIALHKGETEQGETEQGETERGAAILRFVAEHEVTQTLARRRCQRLLQEMAVPHRPEASSAMPERTLDQIVALVKEKNYVDS